MSNARSICLVLPKLFLEAKGGAELQAWYLANELKNRGWKVSYICEGTNEKVEMERVDGVYIYRIPAMRFWFFQPLNLGRLKSLVQDIKPDILYSRVSKAYTYSCSKIARASSDQISIHACSNDADLSFRSARKNPALRLMEWINHLLYIRGLENADLVLAQHNGQKEYLQKNLNVNARVVPNGHPYFAYWNREREQSIVWVGNVKPAKNPKKLIELAVEIQRMGIQLYAIGKGQNDELERLVTDASDRISCLTYLGEQDLTEVNSYIERCYALVNTSKYEGFPNTFIQAWMRGTPVITLGVDPGNVIRDNRLGFVEGSVNDIAYRLRSIWENQDKWRNLSNNCRAYSIKHHNLSAYTDKFEEECEKLLKDN